MMDEQDLTLDCSLINKKYEPMLLGNINDITHYLNVRNTELDLILSIFVNGAKTTTVTIDPIERNDFYIEFQMSKINAKIDGLAVAIIVDWFVNLKEIPSYLIYIKKHLQKNNRRKCD